MLLTDAMLLRSYVVRHGLYNKCTIIALAVPFVGDTVTLYAVANDGSIKPLRVMTVDDLYTWAIGQNLQVDSPINLSYTPEDDDAYKRLQAQEQAQEQARRKELSDALDKICRILGV